MLGYGITAPGGTKRIVVAGAKDHHLAYSLSCRFHKASYSIVPVVVYTVEKLGGLESLRLFDYAS
jgi:hypothetical protein